MPDSKLAEKLGFRVAVPPGAHPEAFDVIYNNGRESDWATPAEIALWNLCLEQGRLLELYRAKRASDGGPGREWHAGKHLAAEEAIAVAEKEKKA